MMTIRRFSEVHDPNRLHEQLNRMTEDLNNNQTEQTKTLNTHASDINALKQQVADLIAQVKALG